MTLHMRINREEGSKNYCILQGRSCASNVQTLGEPSSGALAGAKSSDSCQLDVVVSIYS